MNRLRLLSYLAFGTLVAGCGGGGSSVVTPVVPTVHSAVVPASYTAYLLPNGSDGQPLSIVSVDDNGVVTGVGNSELREWTVSGGSTVVGAAPAGYFQPNIANGLGQAGGRYFVRNAGAPVTHTPYAATYSGHTFTLFSDSLSSPVDGVIMRLGSLPLTRYGALQPYNMAHGNPTSGVVLPSLSGTSQPTGVTVASETGPIFGASWKTTGGGSVLPQAVKIDGSTYNPTLLPEFSGTQLQSNVLGAFADGSAVGYVITPSEVNFVFWPASGGVNAVGPSSADTSSLPNLAGHVTSYTGFWAGYKQGSGSFIWSQKSGFKLLQSLVTTGGVTISGATPVAVNNKGWVVVSLASPARVYVLKPN